MDLLFFFFEGGWGGGQTISCAVADAEVGDERRDRSGCV